MSKPIKIEVTGDARKFNKEMDGVHGKLGKLGKIAAVGGAALGAGLLAGGAALFKIGQDFDLMRAEIVKGTGASGEALEGLFDSAKDVMSSVPDSGALVATALADVNTFFGATGDELEDLTEGFLDFARLTGQDVGDAIEGLDGVMTSFNVSTAEADELMGDLIRVSQATGVSMDALVGTIDRYGPSFAAAGLSAEQAAIMVGQFNVAGLDAEGTGKILDKVLLDAAASGITAEEAMSNLDAQLSEMTGPERLAAMELMVGGRNASQAIAAWESGALSIEQINSQIDNGTGVLAEQTAATASFSDKWNEFKNKVLVKLEPLATRLFEALESGMEWLESDGIPIMEGIVEKFKEFSAWFQENQDYIIGALAALGTVILVSVVPPFIAWAAATVIAMAPIIAIAAAAIAVGVAAVWLWKNWDTVWSKVKEKTLKFAGAVVDFVKGIPQKVKDALLSLPDKVKELGTKLWNAGKEIGGKILSGIKSGLTSAFGFAGDVASGLWRKVKDAVNTNVVDKINTALPNSLGFGPFTIDLPDNPVPRLASGSRNFQGGLALVGEQGPEMVGIPRGSRVFTARETKEMSGAGGGGMSVTVNAQTNADPAEIARDLGWVLRTRGR